MQEFGGKGDDISTPGYTIVIPTKNSARHIDIILRHYARLGAPVFAFVDSSSTDETLDICRQLAARAELIDNPGGRTETMIEAMSKRCDTDWIFRFDDDELPTRALLDAARSVIKESAHHSYGFRLLHGALDQSGQISALRAFENPPHDQPRLYHRDRVTFITDIHTAGFDITGAEIMPPSQFAVHLQWVVRDYAERLRKVESYDRQRANAGSGWRHYYLVEDNEAALATAYPVHLAELAEVAAELDARFPQALRVFSDLELRSA